MENKKQIAIITGASSGMGREFVKLLMREKNLDEIWVIARSEERLQKLAYEYGSKIRTISMDLTKRDHLKQFQEILQQEAATVKYLINNAGFAKFCSYDDISVEESLNMIDLNIGAVVAMGLLCIPYMKRGGRIINIASQASFQPLPYLNIYSATKAFVRNYTRALNVELRDKGIKATAVCPGWMKTGLFERGSIGAEKEINNFSGIVTPDVVAKKALADAKKGKDISVYGWYTKAAHLAAKWLPQRVIMKIWLKQQRLH